jgi:hypothetical protein
MALEYVLYRRPDKLAQTVTIPTFIGNVLVRDAEYIDRVFSFFFQLLPTISRLVPEFKPQPLSFVSFPSQYLL